MVTSAAINVRDSAVPISHADASPRARADLARWESDADVYVEEGPSRAEDNALQRYSHRFYAAALDHIYREQDGLIGLPCLGINSVEALARERTFDRYLTTLVASAGEVRRHFPELDEQTIALSRIESLPPVERAEQLVRLLGTFGGPSTSEDADASAASPRSSVRRCIAVTRRPGRERRGPTRTRCTHHSM
jgi:hypothetical protein